MNVFYTESTLHLAPLITLKTGASRFGTFTDGELYVFVQEAVAKKEVWVVANTIPPSKNFMQLFLLLDALQREGAIIHLLFTYFAYARQDTEWSGEALTAQVISQFIQLFKLKSITIVHAHSAKLKQFLTFKNVIPFDFFYAIAEQFDIIVAPDKGAFELASAIAKHTNKDAAFIKKTRPARNKSEVVSVTGDVVDKRVLIVDDMITTGGTVINAAKRLVEIGSNEIAVAATHGIFSGDACDKIKASPITKVYVTNTIAQKQVNNFIDVVDIAPFLQQIMEKK